MVKCTFCYKKLKPGTGKMYVKKDGKIFYFCSSKCEKNLLKLKRKPMSFKWTKDPAEKEDNTKKGKVEDKKVVEVKENKTKEIKVKKVEAKEAGTKETEVRKAETKGVGTKEPEPSSDEKTSKEKVEVKPDTKKEVSKEV